MRTLRSRLDRIETRAAPPARYLTVIEDDDGSLWSDAEWADRRRILPEELIGAIVIRVKFIEWNGEGYALL